MKEWVEELEKMKKVNFFPYLRAVPVNGDKETLESKKESCLDDNCCGKC